MAARKSMVDIRAEDPEVQRVKRVAYELNSPILRNHVQAYIQGEADWTTVMQEAAVSLAHALSRTQKDLVDVASRVPDGPIKIGKRRHE